MRRVMYLYLPSWPIDRLRRLGQIPRGPNLNSAASADEPPFATVVATGGRRLLAAVNPAAATAGLAPGMPLADALSFHPGLMTAPAAPAEDAAALTRLAEWCGRYSPWTAPDLQCGDADGIKIEVTGCTHLWGGEAALVADLARRLKRQGIAPRLAIATTLGAAWALARFAAGDDRPALPEAGQERDALALLPVEVLRLDPLTVAGLRRVGLKRVGDLLPMPRDALARRFGDAVARRLDQALGALPEPLSPLAEAPVRRIRLSFAEPIADPADLARAAERLFADLVERLAREGMGARRLDLGFHRVDGRVEHIRIGTARPSRDAQHLAKLAIAKLDTVDPGFGVEDMILGVFAVEPLPAEQIALTNSPRAASDGVAPLLDRLGARLGLDALSRLAPRQSHIPERALVAVPAGETATPSPPPGAERVGVRWGIPGRSAIPTSPGRRSAPATLSPLKGGEGILPPRPVRLFAPPEPVEAVWLLPDDPPFRFTWRRRPHRVERADGPERIAEEWWTAGALLSTAAIRDYYRVEDGEGRRFWLFRAGLAHDGEQPPRWFVHGLFA